MGRCIIYRDIKRFISCFCKRVWRVSFVLQKVLVMKKIILLALAALMMVGCIYTPKEYTTRDKKQDKQKPAEWNEEDEAIVLSIKQIINCASLLNIVPEKLDRIDKWLKNLKQRIKK